MFINVSEDFCDAAVARLYSLEWYGDELEGIWKETILA
jgi:hypothetical protein